jgi:flavin reductase (DIM6/NTAB) family NADH-FMN oxidoreductase RutF
MTAAPMSTATGKTATDDDAAGETADVSGAALRAILRQVPAPVTVVTARSAAGGPFGITIGSFASVSLRPPLVSFNVSEEARTYRLLAEAERFAVHFLHREQAELAARFADPGAAPQQQFAAVEWRADDETNLPVLADVRAVLRCRLHARHRAGDSDIVVGRVTGADDAALETDPKGVPAADPLLYHQRGYRALPAGVQQTADRSVQVEPRRGGQPVGEASASEKRSATDAPETPAPKSAKS